VTVFDYPKFQHPFDAPFYLIFMVMMIAIRVTLNGPYPSNKVMACSLLLSMGSFIDSSNTSSNLFSSHCKCSCCKLFKWFKVVSTWNGGRISIKKHRSTN